VVCFLGDSITHGGLYHKDIADFYALRFPERKIKMVNCGIGGDTAGGALGRLDWDVLVHQPTVIAIMLGMNDIGHSNYYSDPATAVTPEVQGLRAKSLETYRAKMTELIETIRAKSKARVILITPSPYDETVQMEGKPARIGAGAAVAKCADVVKELAAKFGTELVEFNAPMTQFNLEKQKTDPKFTLCGSDRVHPGAAGHSVMAGLFLTQQKALGQPIKIDLDAKAGTVEAQGAKAGKVTKADQKWTFEVTENVLPFDGQWLGLTVKDAEAAEITARLFGGSGAEILRVPTLTDGKYRLLMDDKEVGSYRKRELKGEGLNIAAIGDTAPQVKQAKEIIQLGSQRFSQQQVIRSIARTKRIAGPTVNVDDSAAFEAWAAKRLEQLKPETEAGKAWEADMKRFRDAKLHQKEAQEQIEQTTAKIYQSNKPQTHVWTLEQVSGPKKESK
jgi:lysophospholipase L1-like esterase